MAYKDFVMQLHRRGVRDYVQRVVDFDKAECALIAKQYGEDYWDGERCHGYGGYRYDGRWSVVAKEMIEYYGLKAGERILDVGCGKAFLLHEFRQLVPEIDVFGVDISRYGLQNAKAEVRSGLALAPAQSLPFATDSFDLVISLGTLHNLRIFELERALAEIDRVSRDPERAYVMVESYRNEQERVNLMYWQLTCESFYSVDEWRWIFEKFGYRGDFSCIYFE